MALFTLPFALEIVFAYLKKRKVVSFLHGNYNLVFAVAMGVLVHQYIRKEGTIKNSYRKLFTLLWGEF